MYWTTGGMKKMGTHKKSENSCCATVTLGAHPTPLTFIHSFMDDMVVFINTDMSQEPG
jgi:hypothetical protein